MIALIRAAGYDQPIYLHGALETITRYYAARIDLGDLRLVRGAAKAELAGAIVLCPPSALKDVWTRRFPEPVTAFASGWMRVRARARQRGVELPLVDLRSCRLGRAQRHHRGDRRRREVWVTHGAEDALVHWCDTRGLKARPLRFVGYGEEDEGEGAEIAAVERIGGAS